MPEPEPEKKNRSQIHITDDGPVFIPGDGSALAITMSEAYKNGGDVGLLLFGCFMGIQEIARASRETANAIREATAMGANAANGATDHADEMLNRIVTGFDSMPNKPEGMGPIMDMIKNMVRPTQ